MSTLDLLLKKIQNESLKPSSYAHFDKKLSSKKAHKYLEKIHGDKSNVIHHRFYPFISYFQTKRKYINTRNSHGSGRVKVKKRLISLPANKDNLIYKYYSFALNEHYENFLRCHSLESVPTAYRKGMGMSNITSAKEVIDNIVSQGKSWIIKGDFSHFFDNLNHHILKKNLQLVLKTNNLPLDWYKVFKNITQYRVINETDISTKLRKKAKKSGMYVSSPKELGRLINKGELKVSRKNTKGIPQGTSLSATLANVYMCSFDENWNTIISKLNGIYRRYSDDFIIVLPKELSNDYVTKLTNTIIDDCSRRIGLMIERHKTKLEFYDGSKQSIFVVNKFGKLKKSALDYLGFNFDGCSVSLRGRSIYKYQYRGKRGVYFVIREKKIWIQENSSGFFYPHAKITKHYLISTKELRRREDVYTYQGYAQRAQREFTKDGNKEYKVVIQKQADRAVFKNQLLLHSLKK